MQATIMTTSTAKPMLWTGRVLSALAVLFLIMDGVIKVINIQPVVDASILLGLPVDLAPYFGALLLACVALYVIPRTSFLGVVLLTGYLGGAIAIHARVGSAPFSLIFPIMLGALLWVGLYLRDEQLRDFIAYRE